MNFALQVVIAVIVYAVGAKLIGLIVKIVRKDVYKRQLLDEEKYELLGVRNEGGLLAFLAVWEFAEFVFIEHFAVSEKACLLYTSRCV